MYILFGFNLASYYIHSDTMGHPITVSVVYALLILNLASLMFSVDGDSPDAVIDGIKNLVQTAIITIILKFNVYDNYKCNMRTRAVWNIIQYNR
jgi:hypothetical protein